MNEIIIGTADRPEGPPALIIAGGLCIVDRWAGDIKQGMLCSCLCGKTWWEGDNWERFGGSACETCCTAACDHDKWPDTIVIER